MDHSRITCRATDRASGYTREREVEEVVVPFSLLENTGYVWAHLWPVSCVVVLIRLGHHRDILVHLPEPFLPC